MDTSMAKLQELVSQANELGATPVNMMLAKIIEDNNGKEPLHSQLVDVSRRNDYTGAKQTQIGQWRQEHEAQFHAAQPGPTPGPGPAPGPAPAVPAHPGLQQPPLAMGETRHLIGNENVMYWVPCAETGTVTTTTTSGGVANYASVYPDQPPSEIADDEWQSAGGTMTQILNVKAGEYFVWMFRGAAQQEMLPQLMGPRT